MEFSLKCVVSIIVIVNIVFLDGEHAVEQLACSNCVVGPYRFKNEAENYYLFQKGIKT